jgi:hypothetical protein
MAPAAATARRIRTLLQRRAVLGAVHLGVDSQNFFDVCI